MCVCSVASVMSDSWWPHGCSPSGSSVHGTLWARILECAAMLPQGDLPCDFCSLHSFKTCALFPLAGLPPLWSCWSYNLWVSLMWFTLLLAHDESLAMDLPQRELGNLQFPTQPSFKYRPGANRNFLIPNPGVGEHLTETAHPDWHYSKHLHELFYDRRSW